MEICPANAIDMKIHVIIWHGKAVILLRYKEAIFQLVGRIQDEKTLKRIYRFVLYLYAKEAGS